MTLTAVERDRLLNSHTRECRVRFWLFPRIEIADYSGPSGDINLATWQKPIPQISPPYSLLRPGESVTLYGGDSFQRGGTPATGHTWTLVSGSAVISPSGNTCVVTPLVEDEVVTVKLTVTASNGVTAYRYAYTVASVDGWAEPCGQISVEGGYDRGGWSGSVQIFGDTPSAADLDHGKLLLIHIDTVYDGNAVTMGGYKRANNLVLLRVEDWTYGEDHTTGRAVTTIRLGSPKYELEGVRYKQIAGETDGEDRGFVFEKNSTGSGFNYGSDVRYRSDFRLTDAALFLAAHYTDVTYPDTPSQYYNFTIFHDPNEFGTSGSYFLPTGNAWELMDSTMRSILCLSFCNFAGSIQLIPSPYVRADEWWGTPDEIWDEAAPLTKEYLRDWEIDWRDDEQIDGVVLSGYDDTNLPVKVTYGNPNGERLEEYDGYIITDTSAALQWAADLYAMHNRDWDAVVSLACIGNVLNVGDFVRANLNARQTGHASAQGLAYVNAIKHDINIDAGTQRTTAALVQITNWGA